MLTIRMTYQYVHVGHDNVGSQSLFISCLYFLKFLTLLSTNLDKIHKKYKQNFLSNSLE